MRWRFIDPKNRTEVARRNAMIARIDAWWGEFQAKTEDLSALFSQKAKWDLPGWVHQNLNAIDPRLMWEFGPGVTGEGHRLVITPESAHHLRPLVRTILDRAPVIKGWEFYAHRLAEDLDEANRTVEARVGCDLSEFRFQASLGEHQRIDLNFTSPRISSADDDTAFHAAFVATETLLGEECLNEWIGVIGLTPGVRARGLFGLKGKGSANVAGFHDLERLKATVEALIGSIEDQLPPEPHFERVDDARWTLWKLEPETADEYAGQLDLFVGGSMNPTIWHALRSGTLFSSRRFSRCGETFCYLKIDGSEGLSESSLADRAEIEDALDEVLRPARLGCKIGGGTGLRYSYIDLALTDLDQGIELACQRLRAGNVPRRCWILFHDTELAAEWVGIYDDTPPPPLDPDDQ